MKYKQMLKIRKIEKDPQVRDGDFQQQAAS